MSTNLLIKSAVLGTPRGAVAWVDTHKLSKDEYKYYKALCIQNKRVYETPSRSRKRAERQNAAWLKKDSSAKVELSQEDYLKFRNRVYPWYCETKTQRVVRMAKESKEAAKEAAFLAKEFERDAARKLLYEQRRSAKMHATTLRQYARKEALKSFNHNMRIASSINMLRSWAKPSERR